ncbi:MAG: hypothetical protein L0Y72_18365 [Gemmataceae bacterium]|nr:hypothetical protein [Gemmataceae bacterium]MCI0741016.1 hypothetical protein [Gemmataceae bacterium]
MDATRRRDLESSLLSQLNQQTQEHGLSRSGRLLWLVEQLHNYVERWHGMRSVSEQSAADDDLFQMIEIAAAVISNELKRREQ